MRLTTMPRLRGERVLLRSFETSDRELVVSASADPLIPLITSVPADPEPAAVAAFIARQRGRLAEGAGCSFAIEDVESGRAVGQIGLWSREADGGRASVGYWIGPEHRRRGFLVDALRTLTRWASSLEGLHRLQLFVEPWNEGSWRAAEACGYEREGLLRAWQVVGGEPKDMYVYGRVCSA